MRFGQPSGGGSSNPGFGLSGAVAGLAVFAIVIGGLLWTAAAANVASAQHPTLFGGSLVLEDASALTVVNVATAQVTVSLLDVNAQVGAATAGDVEAVPVDEGTILLDKLTGSFNLLGKDNYLVDPSGAGVGLGELPGTTAQAFAAGSSAYIVRFGHRSTVSLVDQNTVAAAARLEAPGPRRASPASAPGKAIGTAPVVVTPPGFAALGGPVSPQAGSAAVAGSDLWTLVGSGRGCSVEQLHPAPLSPNGLLPTSRVTMPVACSKAALESSTGIVGVATPGGVTLFTPTGPRRGLEVAVARTSADRVFLPVTGNSNGLWYLGRSVSGWSLVGVSPRGKVTGPLPLSHLGPAADPVVPALSAGYLYTLDQGSPGQPELWAINASSGGMAPVAGAVSYPAASAAEKASFVGAQVLVDGPRIVFNNPQSHEAVVVFTDGSHSPVVVNKGAAVTVSATGPADLNLTTPPGEPGGPPTSPSGANANRPIPVLQAVSQKVTCATTTQKPYAPQITSISPSSGAALIDWSYQLLDQTDCEPDSWAVHVMALTGSHQPAEPLQVVNGQSQYLFGGLRPTTTYQVIVTAFINAQSTGSTPATFTTSARGPDAPLSVTTTSDGNGNWVVKWVPCLEAANSNCIVPANTWSVIGAACGTTFAGRPPTVTVPGAETSAIVSAGSFLGDSMSFSVQGSLVSGLTGKPTSDHSCVQAWRPPTASDISLTASGARSADGQTIDATLQVLNSGTAAGAFGSLSTEFVYQVGDVTVGPTEATRITVPGLVAGQLYTPIVTVFPTGHPSAMITVTGPAFGTDLQWPTTGPNPLGISVDATVNPDPNTGTLVVSFPNVPSGSMTAAGTVQCGGRGGATMNVGGPLSGGSFTVSNFDLADMGGSCTVTATLSDTANPNPYGVSSPSLTTAFSIGQQPGYTFTDQISPPCQHTSCEPPQLEVDYGGSGPLSAGDGWTISTSSTGNGHRFDPGDPCASSQGVATPPTFPLTISLPSLCSDPSMVDVTISYTYLGVTTYANAGTPSGNGSPPPATTTTTPPSTTTTTLPTTTTTVASATTTTSPPSSRRASPSDAVPDTQLARVSRPQASIAANNVRSALGWAALAVMASGGPALLARRVTKNLKKGTR
jgi:hypothetical protein